MDVLNQPVFQIIIEIIIFLILTFIGGFVANKIRNSSNRYLNPEEFLPEDEIHTLRQVFSLILRYSFQQDSQPYSDWGITKSCPIH